MNIILLSVSIFFNVVTSDGQGDVYVCNNHSTKKYHLSPTCKGLSHCQFKIVKLSAQTAKNKKMTLCGWESKKNK